MEKKTQINLLYVLIAFSMLLFFQNWLVATSRVEPIPYSQFIASLEADKIEEVTVKQNVIEGKFREPEADGHEYFVTTRVEPEIAELLKQRGVRFKGTVENTLVRDILSWILPVLLFVGIWMFLIRRMAEKQGLGGLMSVGRSKAKVYVETDTKVTFDDVAGVDEAKDELEEIVAFLKKPQEYGRLGARIPKGILLIGAPGTGKTLLARAVAGEAGVPFFSMSGSEFVEMFVGVGAARVRDLFDQARRAAPCIIFIDELDALGRARGIGPMAGGHDEKEQTLNQLLTELDGFDPSQGIVLLAATNRPEILDAALLRAGRFDRQVLLDRPDKIGRLAILTVHAKKATLVPDIELEQVAALTPGFTGADLANLVNEAALLATRRGGDSVTLDDFTAAIERIVAGLEKKNRLLNPHERKVVAYHEMGHALVAATLPSSDAVHKVSIIPRGVGALGYTLQRPTEDRFLMSRGELIDKMTVLLGGRTAEALVFDEISTGAADDLGKATDIARHMVTRYGMSEKLGSTVFEPERNAFLGENAYGLVKNRDYSEETAQEIDREIRDLVEKAYHAATAILTQRREDLERGATLLLEKETLTVEEFPALAAATEDQRDGSP